MATNAAMNAAMNAGIVPRARGLGSLVALPQRIVALLACQQDCAKKNRDWKTWQTRQGYVQDQGPCTAQTSRVSANLFEEDWLKYHPNTAVLRVYKYTHFKRGRAFHGVTEELPLGLWGSKQASFNVFQIREAVSWVSSSTRLLVFLHATAGPRRKRRNSEEMGILCSHLFS